MRLKKPKIEPKVSAGSMADIAFLLLIFFLVSTSILQEKGLMLQLPPDVPPTDTPIKDRNLFKILINSKNQFMIEGDIKTDLSGLVEDVKLFVKNPSLDPTLSESPEKAIISIKTNRGADYGSFIKVLDLIKESYYQMYGERVGLSADGFRKLNRSRQSENKLYHEARLGLPMNISIAEPDKLN